MRRQRCGWLAGDWARHAPAAPDAAADPFWNAAGPPTLVIEEVERIWDAIDQREDWQPLADKVVEIRSLGIALGPPPAPLPANAEFAGNI